jgi:hypothetical protein
MERSQTIRRRCKWGHSGNTSVVKAAFTVLVPSLILAFQPSRFASILPTYPSSNNRNDIVQRLVKPTSSSSLTYPDEQDRDQTLSHPPTTNPTTVPGNNTSPSPLSNNSILGDGTFPPTSIITAMDAVSSPIKQVVASIQPPSLLRRPNRMKFRMKLFSLLCEPKVEVVSAGAVLLSSFLVALSTLQDLPTDVDHVITSVLWILDWTFAADFFARWYAAGQFKWRYLIKPLTVIDLVVVIVPLVVGTIMPLMTHFSLIDALGCAPNDSCSTPLVMPNDIDMVRSGSSNFFSQAGLQNLLLLRVLRLRRVLTDMTTFGRFTAALGIGTLNNSQTNTQIDRPYQLQLARVLLSIFTLLSVATGLIYTAEHDVNPDIPDYFTALYFGLTTLTTGTYSTSTVRQRLRDKKWLNQQNLFLSPVPKFGCMNSRIWRYYTSDSSRSTCRVR